MLLMVVLPHRAAPLTAPVVTGVLLRDAGCFRLDQLGGCIKKITRGGAHVRSAEWKLEADEMQCRPGEGRDDDVGRARLDPKLVSNITIIYDPKPPLKPPVTRATTAQSDF
jgi:hypothetical protein